MKSINDIRETAIHGNLSIERTCFVFFDIETTGLHAYKGAKIIESACITRNEVLQNWRINPQKTSDDALVTMLPELMNHLKKGVLVGHNICFDLNFIAYKAGKLGINGPEVNFIDTMMLSKRILEKIRSYKLEFLLHYFDIAIKGELHTAMVDVHATQALFWKLIEKGEISTLKEAGVKRVNWTFC